MSERVLIPNAMVTDGRLPEYIRVIISERLKGFEGKRVTITIDDSKKRSNPQNDYYHGVIVKMVHDWMVEHGNDGLDVDVVHEYLKRQFPEYTKKTKEITLPDGEVISQVYFTTKIPTKDFSAYMEKCQVWAADRDLYIPLPNETMEQAS